MAGDAATKTKPPGFSRYQVDFNAGWSDVQAEANGWVQTGTKSFSDTLANVDDLLILPGYGVAFNDQDVPFNEAVHFDNFVAHGVPEPATMGLIAAGGALLMFRRRRAA